MDELIDYHYHRARHLMLVFFTFVALVLVMFGTLYFATEPEQYQPAPCNLVAVGSQAITRSNGTTVTSHAPIKKECAP